MKEKFESMVEKFNQSGAGFGGKNVVYQFDLDGDKFYQVEVQNDVATFYDHPAKTPDCTIQMSSENLLKLLNGELNPPMAVMTGKIKIKGDISLAMKLQSLLKA